MTLRHQLLALAAGATLVATSAAASAATSAAQTELDSPHSRDAEAVWTLLSQRCAPCHSPAHPASADQPRALREWSGAHSLAAVVESAVMPGQPEESDLFLLVEFDEMPPEDAPQARLSPAEKSLIKDWIAAGAPLPPAAPGLPTGTDTNTDSTAGAPILGPGNSKPPTELGVLEAIGRFHPLFVHFPIALLLAALPAAFLGRRRPDSAWAAIGRYCAILGTAGALIAAALGWCAHEAGAGGRQPALVERHEWSGFIAAGLALAAIYAAREGLRGRPFGRAYLFLLAAAAVAVSLAGHWGAQLVWGTDFLPTPF